MLNRYLKRSRLVGCAALMVMTGSALATDLSNNLARATGGTESASGARWLCASFGTGSAAHTLNAVTLLMAQTAAGVAEVRIHADGGLEPGALVATLNAPGTIAGTLTPTTFTGAVPLSAGSTYWIVLRPVSGSFDWAWSGESTGTGVGFQYTWGVSDDSGTFWWTQNRYPTQFRAVVDEGCSADLNGDGIVDFGDYLEFLNLYDASDPRADFTGDGIVDFSDYLEFLNHYDAGCWRRRHWGLGIGHSWLLHRSRPTIDEGRAPAMSPGFSFWRVSGGGGSRGPSRRAKNVGHGGGALRSGCGTRV